MNNKYPYVPKLKHPRFFSWRQPDKLEKVKYPNSGMMLGAGWDTLWVDWLFGTILDKHEHEYFINVLDHNPSLRWCLDRVIFHRFSFRGGGLVRGFDKRGEGDEVPALLQDRTWVMTKKSVDEIGIHKLYRMLKEADPDWNKPKSSQEHTEHTHPK